MNILVTGVAGFIGNAVAIKLLQRGDKVTGLDNMNNYYSVELKEARLKRLNPDSPDLRIYRIDICDKEKLAGGF